MNCRDAHKLVVHAQDSRLPLGQRLAVRYHLLICQGCRNFRRQMAFLRAASQHFPGTPPPNRD